MLAPYSPATLAPYLLLSAVLTFENASHILYLYLRVVKIFLVYSQWIYPLQVILKRPYPASMEECKKRAQGTKVSKIANIFQGMPSRDDEDMRGSDVTVVRTESHLARFNNARALFEKLGEENRNFRIEKSPSAAASFAGTRGVLPVVPSRSRSSSAGSVSPTRNTATGHVSLGSTVVNGDRLSNGAGQQPPPKPIKPSVLPKPEKPDRRFNKELIEKQRNWTAHFNKQRPSRHDQDQRIENRSTAFQDRRSPEVSERHVVPSRAYSPPLSPGAGDTHIERPSTLPSALVSRGIHVAKSPSPNKNIAPVLPSPRSSNVVSPTHRTDVLISPSVKRDDLISPARHSPQKSDSLEKPQVYYGRGSISPDTKKSIIEKDELKIEASSKSVTPTENLFPSETPSIPSIVDDNLSFIYNKPLPSPPICAPRSPPPPIPETKTIVTGSLESVTEVNEITSCISKVNISNDDVDFVNDIIKESRAISSITPADNESELIASEASVIQTPDVDVVPRSPPKSRDDDYETVNYSDWDDKIKRKSLTCDSNSAVLEEEAPKSLEPELASPGRDPEFSPSPAPTPVQGMYLVSYIRS